MERLLCDPPPRCSRLSPPLPSAPPCPPCPLLPACIRTLPPLPSALLLRGGGGVVARACVRVLQHGHSRTATGAGGGRRGEQARCRAVPRLSPHAPLPLPGCGVVRSRRRTARQRVVLWTGLAFHHQRCWVEYLDKRCRLPGALLFFLLPLLLCAVLVPVLALLRRPVDRRARRAREGECGIA